MSAIAGVWQLDGAPHASENCARMLSAQAAYGPHGSAQWADASGDVAIGRRLFVSLPEDHYDTGPLISGDGELATIDARLDNRDELQAKLEIAPQRYRSMCDAAVLLAAWERWGDDCFEHLVGDYAFALWDSRRRWVVLARDPMGGRPLHYHRAAKFAAWASMPAGLHALAEIPKALDEARLAGFLALEREDGPRSFFQDIQRVEPGQVVALTADSVRIRSHWSPARRTLRLASADDYAQALCEQLDQAVDARLRGARDNVGAHLSSGWDSSAVAATAARLLAPSGGRVIAFTAVPRPGYDGAAPKRRHGDEGVLAAITAGLYANMEHVRVAGSGRSPLDDTDADAMLCGTPILNPCNKVWDNDINRAAKSRGLTVMLTGLLGNITLTDDGLTGLRELVDQRHWGPWLRHARAVARGGAMRWRGILAASFEHLGPAPLWETLRRLNGEWRGEHRAYSALRPERWPKPDPRAPKASHDQVDRRFPGLRWFDLGPFGKGALARWGIDVRDPLADRRLIEFCLSIPMEQRLAGGQPRALARRALADRLPAAVLDAPSRGYQGIDWHEGLTADRGELLAELERQERCAPVAALIDISRLRRLAQDWPSGGWERDALIFHYRLALLRGVATGRFLRRALGANG